MTPAMEAGLRSMFGLYENWLIFVERNIAAAPGGSMAAFYALTPKGVRRWGNWHFVAKNFTLQFKPTGYGRYYEFDLEKVTDSAYMLNCIFQLNSKAWATPEDIADLVKAFGRIFKPQRYLCTRGKDKKLDAPRYLRRYLRELRTGKQ